MKRNSTFLACAGVVLAVTVIISYFSFSARVTSCMQADIDDRLTDIVDASIVTFEVQMREQVKKISTVAAYLGEFGELGTPEQLKLLQLVAQFSSLERCTIFYPDGSFATQDGLKGNPIEPPAFLERAMAGELLISDPAPSVVDSRRTELFTIAAPIKHGDEVTGVLSYSFRCSDFNSTFNMSFLDGKGSLLVVKEDGALLLGSSPYAVVHQNIVQALSAGCTHQGHTQQSCLELYGYSGSKVFTMAEGQSYMAYYRKLEMNDWYILSLVPQEASLVAVRNITQAQWRFGLVASGSTFLYLVLLFVVWRRQVWQFDKMTGAMTLESFKHKAKRILHQNPGTAYVVVKLDVKDFKFINRIYDYETGDAAIRNIIVALRSAIGEHHALIARTGVDAFVLMLPYHGSRELDSQRYEFIAGFRKLMGVGFTTIVEFPTGQYVVMPGDAQRPDITEILEKVNFAHRCAKLQGAGGIVDYVESLESQALFEKNIEDHMRPALENGEFRLYLQPKYRVADEKICGAEALVRWIGKDGVVVLPGKFIPVFERDGFIVQVDMYMYERVVQKLRAIIVSGGSPVPISVNFSRLHLENKNFVTDLCAIADKYHVPRHLLELELTESTVFDNVSRIAELITQLHAQGFTLSLDDFGSGYSSLGLLKDLDIDVLKLDKAFFDYSDDPHRSNVIIEHILHMARELGITTVAEGVETREQVELLRQMSCDIIQGYCYSRPIPEDDFVLPAPNKGDNKDTGSTARNIAHNE